ncbi:hypothetical protein GBAR_LOCUS12481 [Geodia barretti]|uniref:Uncharacterized protein n=1 Tax=Geodia barretti TaxID=519541 RepID=A0AA35S1L5_GEOBA|nr:hypothetical protein GBAR_LOCUS12481 [Geodia barretti]
MIICTTTTWLQQSSCEIKPFKIRLCLIIRTTRYVYISLSWLINYSRSISR